MRPGPTACYPDAVDDLTQGLVRRMREDGRSMSRNRNFHTFADPQARRALRIVRHLRFAFGESS